MGVGCGVGATWLIYNYKSYNLNDGLTLCLVKNVTGIPCPSCGSTRAVEALIHGNIIESVLWNPFGLLLTSLLVILPVWLLLDLSRRSDSLFNFYFWVETMLKQKKYAIPAIALATANWIWNIYKGL